MSVSGSYTMFSPPFDQQRSFPCVDLETLSPSGRSSLCTPQRPVSAAASETSSSFLLDRSSSPDSATYLDSSSLEILTTKCNRHRQFVRLAGRGLVRFLLTATLVFALYGTLKGYERHGLIGENGKKAYNTLTTALSMALGISLASSFKAIALDLRWLILSRKKRPIEEVNAILACSSLTQVSVLAAKYAQKKKPGLVLSCALWVIFNIAAQAGVAMLSLTFSLSPSLSGDPSTPVPGQVVFSNMSQSFGVAVDTESTESSQLAAHTFGEVSLQYRYINLDHSDDNELPQIDGTSSIYLSPVQEPLIFNDSKNSYLQYVFQETTAENTSTMGYFYSTRSIVATSNCMVYKVEDNPNDLSQSFQIEKDGELQTQNFSSIALKSTTYLTSPNELGCGPRCANVCAFESSDSKGWYYECSITISEVSNAIVNEQRVSDATAKMAAGAIALQGYQAQKQDSQYQRFPAKSYYGKFLDGNSAAMAHNMRQFAIGVFAVADLSLSDIDPEELVEGFLPDQGLVVSFDHRHSMWAIFSAIIGCHFILFIVAAWISSKVVVVEDDFLAIALLLTPLTEAMKNKGCLLNKERRERVGNASTSPEITVCYGPRETEKMDFRQTGVRQLEISMAAESGLPSKKWEKYFDS